MPSILVIDDDELLNGFITRSLTRQGFTCASAFGGVTALQMLERQNFDVVVCDFAMDDVDGLDVLRACTKLRPAPPFIMITAHGKVSIAVEAMKLGAADFMEKPVSIEVLRASIKGAINRNEAPAPASMVPKPTQLRRQLVGSSRWLDPFMQLLERIARTDTVVLIDGETGTGKSAVAREIWRHSRRAEEAIVELNCGAIPDNLVESELFGHEKGAFTDASGDHPGKVKQAEKGTLFLDEIGELPLHLQPKLLHLLSSRSYTPLGASHSSTANVRFIAATNRDLQAQMEAGQFRADLFFRLNVMGLTIPPLRERTDDVPVLTDYFRSEVAERVGHACPEFSPDAMRMLLLHPWPGNVRELENLVEKMAIIVGPDRPVDITDLPAPYQRGRHSVNGQRGAPTVTPGPAADPHLDLDMDMDLKDAVVTYERALIVDALRQEQGNRTKAAKRLKLKRTTLIEKIGRFSIEANEYDKAD